MDQEEHLTLKMATEKELKDAEKMEEMAEKLIEEKDIDEEEAAKE